MEEKNLKADIPGKTVEGKDKKKIKIRILAIAIISIFVPLLVVGVVLKLFDKKTDIYYGIQEFNVPEVYKYSGNILFVRKMPYGNFSLTSEFIPEDGKNSGEIKLCILQKNKLVSSVIAVENVILKDFNDYSICLKDYNADGDYEFSYISSISKGENGYKVYTINQAGQILQLGSEEHFGDSKKVSIALVKENEEYKYNDIEIFYDDYPLGTDLGTYELKVKKDNEGTKISQGSKISMISEFDPLPRVGRISESNNEKLLKINDALNDYDKLTILRIDLDNDGEDEKVVYATDGEKNISNVFLFNRDDILIKNLLTGSGSKMEEAVEFVDIDGDDILEILSVNKDGENLQINKYCFNYFF